MSANMKEIKGRIESIKSTSQITNAMNVVSSTKFKKFQTLTLSTRKYSEAIEETLGNVAGSLKSVHHVFFDGKREVKKIGVIMMTSDRGLCGSFNSNTFKELEKLVAGYGEKGVKVSVIAVGRKSRDYCKRRGINVDAEYIQLIPETMFEKAKGISENIAEFYLSDIYDEVHIIYSKFISAIQYELKAEKLLPLERREAKTNKEYIFEPSIEDVLRSLLPKSLNIKIYQSLLENTASEHSARMTAMQSASDNAKDILDELTLDYNRVRQSIITQELTEIIGGSNALK
ncbi:MAG: ATP synthase F1 subunit gamma [Fusobacteriales bacterium]|jgi:F-type H+-transporting ATPase subunit gamma|nr:ATP synthase F1 subunit gamma [Fusobacteriales bacterium]